MALSSDDTRSSPQKEKINGLSLNHQSNIGICMKIISYPVSGSKKSTMFSHTGFWRVRASCPRTGLGQATGLRQVWGGIHRQRVKVVGQPSLKVVVLSVWSLDQEWGCLLKSQTQGLIANL